MHINNMMKLKQKVSGVGKTRLICAHVCSQKMTLDQLMTVHTPTVWAVDPYRIYSDVMNCICNCNKQLVYYYTEFSIEIY